MQVRYLIDPDLARPQTRLAPPLISALSERVTLKAEFTRKAELADWPEHYADFSRPLFSAQFQLFHGQSKDYQPHPIQWNILLDPEVLPASSYDEVWFFSERDRERLSPTTPTQILPPLASPWPITPQAPVPLEGELMVFCALAANQSAELRIVLKNFLSAFGQRPEVMLALYLIIDEQAQTKVDMIETELIAAATEIGEALNLDLETLNIGSWIAAFEKEAYLGFLKASQLLLHPLNTQAAHEALAEAKSVVYLENAPQQVGIYALDALTQALEAAVPEFENHWDAALEQMQARLTTLSLEVDFEARAAAVKQAAAEGQAGRKQKYSLFHSDYDANELQGRRNWHARYAAYFKGCLGDVLDIGSGSGIFLEIMRDDLKQPAFGLDPDPDMVAVCDNLKLQSLLGDERRLSEMQDNSLGGIHASHVIEHVDGDRAIAMVENALRVLRPGGKLLVRTPNWRNQTVRHEGFWLDITHIRPYPLPLLEQVFQDSGFEIVDKGFEEFGWNDTYIVGQKPEGDPS